MSDYYVLLLCQGRPFWNRFDSKREFEQWYNSNEPVYNCLRKDAFHFVGERYTQREIQELWDEYDKKINYIEEEKSFLMKKIFSLFKELLDKLDERGEQ